MQVHRSIESLPSFEKAVITIGTFDGVHLGHKRIIDALVNEAKAINGESVLITFDPHPRKIVKPEENLQLINTLNEKIWLLEQTEVDHLVIVPFTSAFAALSADDYIRDFLIKTFHPHTIIIGYDHHFGKGRTGNFNLLASQADRFGYRLLEIPKYLIQEIGVSSTKIRNAILESQIASANRLLGYAFFFEGFVVKGDQLGRELGYPTANLIYTDPEKIHLGHGVYAVNVCVDGKWLNGMLSIGNRPTLANSDERIEVNIFDWSGDLYGRKIIVRVQHFLRPQEKYASLQALVQQLAKDKDNSLQLL